MAGSSRIYHRQVVEKVHLVLLSSFPWKRVSSATRRGENPGFSTAFGYPPFHLGGSAGAEAGMTDFLVIEEDFFNTLLGRKAAIPAARKTAKRRL